MGLFRKKKEEILNLDLNKNTPREKKVIPTFKEKEEVQELSLAQLIVDFRKHEVFQNQILKEYYLCTIFSRINLLPEEIILQTKGMQKSIDFINDIINRIKVIINKKELSQDDIVLLSKENKLLDAVQKETIKRFKDINKAYYNYKISTVSCTVNKNNEELIAFDKNIKSFLKDFKDSNEASQHIYYHSGDFIVSLVKDIIIGIYDTGDKEKIKVYNYEYFLETDVIITLDISKWADLNNKINYALRLLKDIEIDKYLNIIEKVKHFEVIYTILIVNNDRKRKENK